MYNYISLAYIYAVTMNDDDFTGKNIFIIIVVIATIFMASLTIGKADYLT